MNYKRFLFISKNTQDALPVINQIAEYLLSRNCEIYCLAEKRSFFGKLDIKPVTEQDVASMDIAIAFGGDGTILKAAKLLIAWNIPILGVNMGTIGYLTDTEPEDAMLAVKRIFNNEFSIEHRCALKVTSNGTSHIGINEAVIHRGSSSHILTIKTKIDGQYIDALRADGVIVATPTGSTAYNLSAGGPIVTPLSNTMVFTPICAHSLSARPIVIANKSIITITVSDFRSEELPSLDIDGKTVLKLQEEASVDITVAECMLPLIRTKPGNFFKFLRSKLESIN